LCNSISFAAVVHKANRLSTLKETATHSAIYSLGNLAVKLAGLIMLPIIASNLSIGEYGIYGLIEAVNQIMVSFLSLKLPIAAMRLAGNKTSESDQRAFFSHSMIILAAVSVAFLAISWLLSRPLGVLLTGDGNQFLLVMLVMASIAFEMLGQIPIYYLRFNNRSVIFVTLSLTKLAVLIGLIYFLVEIRQQGILGLVSSFAIANLVFLVLGMLLMYTRPMPYRYNSEEVNALVKFGFPLIFTSIITILLTTSDRYIIRIFHEFDDIGVYSVAIKIAGIVTFVMLNAFFLAYTPIAYKKQADATFQKLQPTILKFVLFIAMVGIWFLSLFGESLLHWLTKNADYVAAAPYVPYLGIVIGFSALQNFLSMSFHYANQTAKNIPILLIAITVNIVLAFILVPIHPIYGSLGSSIAAMFAMLLMTYKMGLKVYPDYVGYSLLVKLMMLIMIGSGICIAANYIEMLQGVLPRIILFVSMSLVTLQLLSINISQVIKTLKSWFGI
jgi:O-antigen/teichoic acid export membrane protein